MRSVLASFVAVILVLAMASADAFSEEIALKPKLTGKAPQQLLAPLISSSNPAVVVYFDEALTTRTQCTTSGIITAYIVAESFGVPISSITYTIQTATSLVFLDEEIVTGTATGSAPSGINITFTPPVDASNQLLLERVRYTMSTNCPSGCPTTSRTVAIRIPRAFDENSLEILTTAYNGYACAQGLGDLIIESFTAPASARLYDDIGSLLSATVKNVGAVTCTSSSFSVSFYLSADTIIATGDMKLAQTGTALSLPPGQTTTATPSGVARIPLNAPTGNVYLIARADENQAVTEQNENNNTLCRSITITNPLFDTTYVYAEDFQEGDGGWTAKDRTASEGVSRWSHISYNDGSGDLGVMWCGTDDPSYSKPPGYGNLWSESLQKTFMYSAQTPLTITYMIQHDTEPSYDNVYLQISTDGETFSSVQTLTGVSSGFEQHEYTTVLGYPMSVIIRFMFVSDESFSDEDGFLDSDGACRLDWVEVTGYPRDNFDTDSDGWSSGTAPGVGGAFRLVYNPICDPAVPCEKLITGKPMVACNSWVAYDPGTEQFPFASPADIALGRGVDILIESPTFSVPANAMAYYLEFDVYQSLTRENGVYYYWELSSPAGGAWITDNFVFYGNAGWVTTKMNITPYVNPTATTLKIRLGAKEMVAWGTSEIHSPGPYFDNVKVFVGEVASSGPGVDIGGFPRACTASDTDWDGVGDLTDACPAEAGSPFDRDGDGCLDEAIGARHVEYLSGDTLAYFIHEQALPYVGDGSDITAIQQGMGAWSAVPDVDLAVGYRGTTTQRDAQALDGINLVTCTDPDYVFPTGVLAVGLTTSYTEPDHYFNGRPVLRGQIVDCDLIFNPLMQFKTATQGSGTDLRSVTTHEVGHLMGLSHSAVKTSTMFYVLPPGTEASSLEPDDIMVARRAYADPASLALMSRLKGTVTDGRTGSPVPGAIVFAIGAASGDTLSSEYTLLDGSFDIAGLPNGSYYVAIYPLNGSSVIAYLQPANINEYVLDHAVTLFVPEYYDAAESQNDDPAAKVAVTVAAGTTTTVPIVTNIDEAGPAVASASPAPAAVGVHIDASMLISFSEPIDLATVGESFNVRDSISGAAVGGNAALISDDSTLAFIPRDNLAFDAVYELRVDTTLTDKFGNRLPGAFVMRFRTEAKPDVGISSLAPRKGVAGAIAVVSGFGFEDDAADLLVDFNGVPAPVLDASSTRLVITIPAGATTGNVTVTNLVEGKTSNALTFTVLRAEEVARGFAAGSVDLPSAPRSIDLYPDGSIAFVATESGYSAVIVDAGAPNYLASASFAVPGGLDAIAVTADGKYAYAVGAQQGKLYRINAERGAGGLSDLMILNEMETGGTPVGIAIDPAGRRAYVADGDEVLVWDVNPRSATFDREIGRFAGFAGGLRGKLATDPAGDRLITLSGAGKMYVYDIAGDSLLATIQVGYDPRDVAVDPIGERAYVTDGNGFVTIVSLDLLERVFDMSTAGSLRGAAVTPAGSFLYAANRELDIFDVVDLRSNRETYRSVVANMPLPTNPVDAAISPDGLYAYALSESERRLAVTAIGVGPVLRGLWPPAGPVGTKVVLAGSAFEADAEVLVSFAGTTVVPEYRGDSVLVAAVPAGATSGPVSVIGRNPFRADAPSNQIYFEVLGATTSNALRRAAAIPGGADLGGPLAVSAAGGVALVAGTGGGGGGGIKLLDVDPASPTFHQFIGEIAIGPAYAIDEIVVAPDGSRAFLIDRGAGSAGAPAAVPVVDINRLSGTFAGVVDSIDVSSLTGGLSGFAVSPSGMSCMLAEYDGGGGGGGRVHLCTIDPETGVMLIVGSTAMPPGVIEALAYHPAGRHCYCAVSDPDAAAVYVLDADPESGAFMTIVGSASVPIAPPKPAAAGLAFTPNGARCLLLTGELAGGAERRVVMINTTDPANPAVTKVQSVGGVASGAEYLAVSPRGDRAIVSLEGEGILHEIIGLAPDSLIFTSSIDGGGTASRVAYRHDASRFYAAIPAMDEMRGYDFASAHAVAALSGNGQSGVVGAELAAALRVRVTDAGGQGVAGIPVTFSVSEGGGVFGGTGTAAQAAVTDALGRADVRWVLGSALGAQRVGAEAPGLVGSPLEFSAAALADPASLPLQLVEVIPAGATIDASVNTAVLAKFSRAVDLATVDSTTFFIKKDGTSVPLAALIGVTGGNTILSITPRAPLDYSATYRVEVTGAIRDGAGGSIDNPSSSSFTTGTAPPPTLYAISPPSGLKGTQVVLGGTGFDAEEAGNVVLFGAAQAGITAAGDDRLGVVVPADVTGVAQTVSVQANGQESNSLLFTILTRDSIAIDKNVIANVSTGSSTRSVAITPDGARLYAVSSTANAIISINLRTHQPYPAIPVGEHPFAIEMHPFGTFAYVTNFLGNTVSVVDIKGSSPAFNTVVETIPVGRNPLDAIVTPDGDRLIVSNVGSNDLTIVDADDQSGTFNRVLATVSTGSSVRSVAVTPDGGLLYVGTSDGYIVVDVVEFAVVANVSTGSSTKSVAVTPDGAFLILLDARGSVFVFDIAEGSPTQNQVVGQVGTGSSVKSVAVTPDGGMLYLIMELFDAIHVYRLSVDTSAGVRGSAFDEAQTRVYATIVDTLFAGEDPAEMVFSPTGSGLAVVTNAGDRTISIFDPAFAPIAVMVSVFGARQVERGALITWATTAEPGVAGYHVLRAEGSNAGYRRITEAPVSARGVGASYSFVDESVRPAQTYFYKLEVVMQRDASKEFGPVEFTYLAQFALRQNAPNPFNPVTRIAFTIPEACRVQLVVYDVSGREVKALVDRRLQADHYEVLWDGTNNRGARVASGMYFYRLDAGKHTASRKMVLLR